jgi:hypothetical protein
VLRDVVSAGLEENTFKIGLLRNRPRLRAACLKNTKRRFLSVDQSFVKAMIPRPFRKRNDRVLILS